METRSHSFFDRVAIAFSAMVVGCGAALVVALPLLLFIGMVVHSDFSKVGALLFWKVPILFGLVSGAVGFISPSFAADWLGKTWKDAVII